MAKTKTASAASTPINSDAMKKLTAKCVELRDAELEAEGLTERLSNLNKRIYAIEHEELPDLMVDVGQDVVGIPADGNMPAYDLKLKPFYQANIAAGWDDDRRKAAFAYLEAQKAGDLIKTTIIISVPREERETVSDLLDKLEGQNVEVKEAVHAATLTSWLKEKSEDGEEVKLDLIGGTVGTVVKPKPRKSK